MLLKKQGAQDGEFVTVQDGFTICLYECWVHGGAIKAEVSALDLKNIKCQVQALQHLSSGLFSWVMKRNNSGGLHKFTRL